MHSYNRTKKKKKPTENKATNTGIFTLQNAQQTQAQQNYWKRNQQPNISSVKSRDALILQ